MRGLPEILSCALVVVLVGACTTASERPAAEAPSPVVVDHAPVPSAPPEPSPSCPEQAGGAWPRAAVGPAGWVRTVAGLGGQRGHLVQTLDDGRSLALRFLGAHVFDLLDKLAHEGGPTELERRELICAVLNDAAGRGVAVLRFWGSLKRTGTSAEIERSADLLALVLDENARRSHPLRFVITLQNHQAGYGTPDPSRSLDDQAEGPWHAPSMYLDDGWRASGIGQLAERIGALRARPGPAASPYVLAWELVNELDTFRHLGGGSFEGAEVEALRDAFLVPAATELARLLPQPIMVGELRGWLEHYAAYADSVIDGLPEQVRARLVWTSHVYAERGQAPSAAMGKLAVDLELADRHGLPFLLGELGEQQPGVTVGLCGRGGQHDFAPLLAAVRSRRIEAVLLWGEGRCPLVVDAQRGRQLVIGAGGDGADISPTDLAAWRVLDRARKSW